MKHGDPGQSDDAVPPEKAPTGLIAYFRSGWAFLVPYAATYLLYAWLGLPVNPAPGGPWIPSLVHVYWALHLLQLVLAAAASRQAWSGARRSGNAATFWWTLLPWLALAAVLGIAGPYLEFPSDPIAHLGRINAWAEVETITASGTGLKTSYLLAYSFVALAPTGGADRLLNFYHTGICLLLFWQYYRLARELKLGAPAGLFFVVLQFAVLGNSAFSFHRYYGLSSTILSQIAAVALVRLAAGHLAGREVSRPIIRPLAGASALVLLIVLNHVQGVLIAASGILALVLWWLSVHHRRWLLALLVVIALASIAVAIRSAVAPSSVLVELRQAGWLNAAGAFDLLSGPSAARHRVLEVLGSFGLVSAAIGLVLFRTNHPGAWLMAVPWCVLLLPATAYPLALYLHGGAPDFMRAFHSASPEHLTVFSRLLLAMPLGLPFAWLYARALDRDRPNLRWAMAIPVGALAAILALPAGGGHQARLWHALHRTPPELEWRSLPATTAAVRQLTDLPGEKKVIGPAGVMFLLEQSGVSAVPFRRRLIGYPVLTPPAQDQAEVIGYLQRFGPIREMVVVLPARDLFVTPASQAALVSRHWYPQEVALGLAGGPELAAAARQLGFREVRDPSGCVLLTNVP